MKEQREVILIKLGGSVITEKTGTEKADLFNIKQFAEEIHRFRDATNQLIILGHGAGSFGHPPAEKYKSIDGINGKESLLGMAVVRDAVARLNAVVLKIFIKVGEPVVTIPPLSILTAREKVYDEFFVQPFVNLLKFGLVPVVHGDVVTDGKIGWTIFSGEQVLNFLALRISRYGFRPKLIVEVGNTEGVYDNDGNTIEKIDGANFTKVETFLKGSGAVDVTGGMAHKVGEAFELAKQEGIPSLLISSTAGNLQKALYGEPVSGTWIGA